MVYPRLDLSDEQAAALLRELNNIIENDRYPLSPRIRMLRGIRAKFLTAPREPPPARPPTPEERSPARAPAAAALGDLMTALGPCDDQINRSAPAARAHEPIAPIENAGPSSILPGHLGGVGLDPVAARLKAILTDLRPAFSIARACDPDFRFRRGIPTSGLGHFESTVRL